VLHRSHFPCLNLEGRHLMQLMILGFHRNSRAGASRVLTTGIFFPHRRGTRGPSAWKKSIIAAAVTQLRFLRQNLLGRSRFPTRRSGAIRRNSEETSHGSSDCHAGSSYSIRRKEGERIFPRISKSAHSSFFGSD